MKKEICWNITARCNQGCKYCHRFLGINELTFEENKQALHNLINQGVKEITWTGGEALLVEKIEELLKISSENGIQNKLITNGIALTDERMPLILPYLDSLTLSLDSIDPEINIKLGRGKEHHSNIKRILEFVKKNNYNIKLRINSVMTKINIDSLNDLANYLNQYNVYSWRIFKFMPLRETSVKNKDLFEITDDEYELGVEMISKTAKSGLIESRVTNDMESKYILIIADGSIVVTRNGQDVKIGNALITTLTGDDIESALVYKKHTNFVNGSAVA